MIANPTQEHVMKTPFTLPTNFPAVDLSKLDVSALPNLPTDKVVAALRDAAYVVIGFGVLTFQQAQVRRRELVDALSSQFGAGKEQIDDVVRTIEQQVAGLDARFDQLESKLDSVVTGIEARLPEQAGALLSQAHGLAKTARQQVRGLLTSAA
jgi:ABC-type transporter Mla subunit MlaD